MKTIGSSWVPLVTFLVVAGGLSLTLVISSLPPTQSPPTQTAWRPAADPVAPRVARVETAEAPSGLASLEWPESESETALETPPPGLADLAPAAGPRPAAADAVPEPQESFARVARGIFNRGLGNFQTAELTLGDAEASEAPAETEAEAPLVPPEDMSLDRAPQRPLTAAGYIVIGSFQSPERAAALMTAQGQWQPTLREVRVDGRLYHRVLVGPFELSDLDSALQRILAAGLADAWRLTVKAPKNDGLVAKSLEILG